MNQRDMETITNAASWCEVVCNEIERTGETAALLDACQSVSVIVRGMDGTYSEEEVARLKKEMIDIIKSEGYADV